MLTYRTTRLPHTTSTRLYSAVEAGVVLRLVLPHRQGIDIKMAIFKRIKSAWQRHGAAGFPKLLYKNIKYYATNMPYRKHALKSEFDDAHKTDTEAIREIGSMDIQSDNAQYAVRYQPSPIGLTTQLLNALDIEFDQYTFIDFGAGKGRVLMLASALPFRRVVGVEFCAELQQTALTNIATLEPKQIATEEVTCIHDDVTRFPLPETPLVCYFYNPFGEVVMRQVVQRLEKSIRDNPRDILVLYLDPAWSTLFDDPSRWSISDQQPGYLIVRANLHSQDT